MKRDLVPFVAYPSPRFGSTLPEGEWENVHCHEW